MKKKINAACLTEGMYVAELDRPWLETNFPFQGFFVDSQQTILRVQGICEYVVIDTLKGRDVEDERLITRLTAPAKSSPKIKTYRSVVPIEDEIEVAQSVRRKAREYIDQVFADVQAGRRPDLSDVREIVSHMVASIVRNPNAQMCLAQLKKRDEYTAQHSVNVCVLSITLGRHLGMPEDSLTLLGMGGLLHDIGKLKTPLEVLNKPDRLTEEEFNIMKSHPDQGRGILQGIRDVPESVIDIAYTHHERLMGHGYPNALTADRITDWSKLVAIVDVYDAITSDRIYHNGMAATEALTKMYAWKEKDFDATLLEQFIQCVGIYPVGSIVELTSGEVGIVISVNPQHRLKPTVMLTLDENKNPYYPARIEDLSRYGPDVRNNLAIKRVLEPGAYGINVGEQIGELGIAK
jgi:putative nucleotidyltransferase with HDIG domain